MACSKGAQKDKDKKMETATGVISCFVRCQKDDESLYAVVCKHVTNHASGTFFVEGPSSNTDIARKVSFDGKDVANFKNDVDIIEIMDLVKTDIRSVYRNESGKEQRVRLYQGKVEQLYGTTVFQCYRPRGKKESDCESKSGRVLPITKTDGTTTDDFSAESHFFVNGIKGKPFAKQGDSGRIVARETDGYIELVGIITWGEYESRSHQQTKENYSVCMLLTATVEHLNHKYKMQLSLYETIESKGTDKEDIEPGQIVTFTLRHKKVPENE